LDGNPALRIFGAAVCTIITVLVLVGPFHRTLPALAFLGVYIVWQLIWFFPELLSVVFDVLGDLF
jgi:hypothetical protein